MDLGKGYSSFKDFIVMPGKMDAVVLGMPWLCRHCPTIDWRGGIFVVDKATLEKLPAKSEFRLEQLSLNLLMSGKQLKRAARKDGTELYLGFVQAMPEVKKRTIGEVARESEFSENGNMALEQMLREYEDVFPENLPGLPPEREVEHEIILTDEQPAYRPQYRLSPLEQKTLQTQLEEMLRLGLVRPSKSPYGALVLFVKKKETGNLPGLSLETGPLTTLTKKNCCFEWGNEQQVAFEVVKRLVAEAIELVVPRPGAKLQLQALGAIGSRSKIKIRSFGAAGPIEPGRMGAMRRQPRLKFQSRWMGPYMVIRVGPAGTYEIKKPTGQTLDVLVHRDHLKRAVVDIDNPPTALWSDETLEELDPGF